MIAREDWPAMLSAIVTVIAVNAGAFLMRVEVVFFTILAVPLAIVVAVGVNYALYGRFRMAGPDLD